MKTSDSLPTAIGILSAGAERINEPLDAGALKVLQAFLENLATYNEHTNLVSDADPQVVVTNHVLDSLTLLQFLGDSDQCARKSLVDIGSGAGFPGLILAIARPHLQVLLVDSVAKKTRFLEQQREQLSLANLRIFTGRVESLGHQMQYREGFDFATARAVADVDVIAEVAVPLLRVGGRLLLQKSLAQVESQELTAQLCLPKVGARMAEIRTLTLDYTHKSLAVIVAEKVKATSKKFPRDWAAIKSAPLSGPVP